MIGAALMAAVAPLAGLQQACAPDRGAIVCTAPVASFDGTALDVTLTLPESRPPRRGRPLVAFLHGLLADKGEYLSDSVEGAGSYKTVRWSNRWFAARGYAVLNYSARGHGASGGSIRLASRDVEVRDARTLIGLLADAGWVAIAPRRVAVIGSSYGGGQAWLLLTTRPDQSTPYGRWRSPGGRLVSLAAVVPGYTWTDLLASLAPNGAEDAAAVNPPGRAEEPIGVAKVTLINGFLASAGTRLPQETYSWMVRTDAGEPYEPASDSTLAAAVHGLTVDRSAYFQHGYFAALGDDSEARRRARRARRRVPARRQPLVPVLAAQGFTDPIFAPIEVLRMWRRLKSLSPGYPIGMYFGDFEHLTSLVKIGDLAAFHDAGTRLIDWAFGRARRPRLDVAARVTDCSPSLGRVLRARSFEGLADRTLRLTLPGSTATTSLPLDPRGLLLDPVVVAQARGRGCLTSTAPPVVSSWTLDAPAPFTLAGLPEVSLRVQGIGSDATLAARLWDVAPDGVATLVNRGVIRLRPPPPDGRVSFQLTGNAWTFAAGHRVQLELTQTDAPYLRPDNFPSALALSDGFLDLPVSRRGG